MNIIQILILIPFAVLILSISIIPFLFSNWWHKHYPKLVAVLSIIVLIYYFFYLKNFEQPKHLITDYISFISLLFSLYVVSGGIFINIFGMSTPWKNVVVLFIGGVIANLVGTTGAAMLLIRPFINSNKYRIKSYHLIFFIFILHIHINHMIVKTVYHKLTGSI